MRPAREPVVVLLGADRWGAKGKGSDITTASPAASTCQRALWMREETTGICGPTHVSRGTPQ